jgi:hypothetical protein
MIFNLLLVPPDTYVTGRYTRICFPLFADHVGAMTASLDSKLADLGNSLVRQIDRYLR